MIKIFLCIYGQKMLGKTVYEHNRTPHRAFENKTPKEVLYGKKTEVNQLRIFGFQCTYTFRRKKDEV